MQPGQQLNLAASTTDSTMACDDLELSIWVVAANQPGALRRPLPPDVTYWANVQHTSVMVSGVSGRRYVADEIYGYGCPCPHVIVYSFTTNARIYVLQSYEPRMDALLDKIVTSTVRFSADAATT